MRPRAAGRVRRGVLSGVAGCPLPVPPTGTFPSLAADQLIRRKPCLPPSSRPPGRECADGRRPTPSSGTASIGTLHEPVNLLVPIEGPEDEEAHRAGPTPVGHLGAVRNQDCLAG